MFTKITNKAEYDIVTLTEAKRQLNIMDTEHDNHIDLLIEAASGLAESYTRRLITKATVTLVTDKCTTILPFGEVESITSVKVNDVDVDYVFNPIRQRVSLVNPVSDEITIVYDAGYASGKVPKNVKMGILMIISSLFENREDSVTGVSVNDISLNSLAILDSVKLDYL